jgi:hypothetical protein
MPRKTVRDVHQLNIHVTPNLAEMVQMYDVGLQNGIPFATMGLAACEIAWILDPEGVINRAREKIRVSPSPRAISLNSRAKEVTFPDTLEEYLRKWFDRS